MAFQTDAPANFPNFSVVHTDIKNLIMLVFRGCLSALESVKYSLLTDLSTSEIASQDLFGFLNFPKIYQTS